MQATIIRRFGLPALFAALLTAGTCSATTDPGGVFGIQATVQFVQVSGGCWTLVASDGARYEPINLPKDLQQDGVRVHVWMDAVDDLASTCMVGRIVEITEIRRNWIEWKVAAGRERLWGRTYPLRTG